MPFPSLPPFLRPSRPAAEPPALPPAAPSATPAVMPACEPPGASSFARGVSPRLPGAATTPLALPPADSPVRGPSALVAVRLAEAGGVRTKETLRFAKHNGPEVRFPLSAEDAEALRNSNAVSPFLPTNPRVLVAPTELAPPTHPGDPGYFAELERIVDMQLVRRSGGDVTAVLGDRVPKLFAGYNLDQAAEAVHADLPSEWPSALLKQFLGEGAKFDKSVVPQLSQADFVNTVVTTQGVLAMATAAVSPSAFACKWHEGRARPEEAIWAIHRGELADVPESLKAKVAALELDRPESATAYPEGSPRHPSWPAMHSAASISSTVLATLLDLSDEQLAEARNLDFAVASFRSVAGVHFESDNVAGLQIGQAAVEQWLPDFLAQCAGADPEVVRAKLAKVRYDWREHPAMATGAN